MAKEVIVGKIVAPHGVRGDIRILPQTDMPELLLNAKYLLLADGTSLTVMSARRHKNLVLVKTRELTTMEAAEAVRGKTVALRREDLPRLQHGFYVTDLLGLPVYDERGLQIGTFKGVQNTGGGADVYTISLPDGREVMLAAIADNVKEINVEERRIVVRLPEWDDRA